ncbi:MAG: hypothetical protein ACR2KV_06280 [Solirubrobacteraceae bacterium]
MRRLVAILALGAMAAVALLTGGGAAGAAVACPGQNPYLPNGAAVTAAAAVKATQTALSTIASDGSGSVTFSSSVCGGFRLVLRAKEIRPGNLGYPRHDGYTTLLNELTHITAGQQTVTFTLTPRGLDLLNYARSIGQPLTTFVIAHVRPDGTIVSSEAIQIVSVP